MKSVYWCLLMTPNCRISLCLYQDFNSLFRDAIYLVFPLCRRDQTKMFNILAMQTLFDALPTNVFIIVKKATL